MLDFTPKTLHYPALVYKHLDTKSSDRVTCMFEREATPENHPGVPRIHVDPISIEDSANVLHGLMDALTGELHRLRAFHRPGGDVHYHQTLGSVLARAIRIVYAMRSLLPHQIEQALVLVRSLYELSLNLNLDWLSPERIGPMFLMQAQGRREDIDAAIRETEVTRIQSGWDQAVARESSNAIRTLLRLVKSAERKSALHPMRPLHGDLYSFLSHQSHQDFVASESFLNVLDDTEDVHSMKYPMMDDDLGSLLQIADSSVAAICFCIAEDIGTTTNVPSEAKFAEL